MNYINSYESLIDTHSSAGEILAYCRLTRCNEPYVVLSFDERRREGDQYLWAAGYETLPKAIESARILAQGPSDALVYDLKAWDIEKYVCHFRALQAHKAPLGELAEYQIRPERDTGHGVGHTCWEGSFEAALGCWRSSARCISRREDSADFVITIKGQKPFNCTVTRVSWCDPEYRN